MAENFKNIKSFWETKANIQLVDNQPNISNNTQKTRKNSIDSSNKQEPKLPQTKPRSSTQHAPVTYQQPRQSVAEMRKNLEGKINIGIPQNNVQFAVPKKREQPVKQPEQIKNDNEIPPFKKSVQNLQAVFSKKQLPFYEALVRQQKEKIEPVQTSRQDQYFMNVVLSDNQSNKKTLRQETPKQETPKYQTSKQETSKPQSQSNNTSKQSYIPVGEKRILSSAMRNISLTQQERANQIISKIFDCEIETKEEEPAKELPSWNRKKKKMNLGEFDEGDD